jgi:hypothetical protein
VLPALYTLAVSAAAVRPGPGTARRLLQRELAEPAYRQSPVERFGDWLQELWARLQQTALHASPLSTAAAVLAVAVLVALAVLVAARVRRETGGDTEPVGPVLTGEVSPAEHRAAASAALERGDHRTALVEAFRALAARATERGLLARRPGLTAHELAEELSPAFPDQREALAAAARSFEGVFYGDQPATAEDARALLALDDALRAARTAAVR